MKSDDLHLLFCSVWQDVMAALEAAGALLLSFNPLTANCITKVRVGR